MVALIADTVSRGKDRFATGDALHRFDFPDHSFHLVMARANSPYVPIERWPALLVHGVTAEGDRVRAAGFAYGVFRL